MKIMGIGSFPDGFYPGRDIDEHHHRQTKYDIICPLV